MKRWRRWKAAAKPKTAPFEHGLKKCDYSKCQKVIQPGRYGKRKYCTEAHKQAAFRERQAERNVTIEA